MRIDELGFNNEQVLDRICEAYGFSQKIQLAKHFEIASSSLANRYSRESISYDFIVHCSLETGASVAWLLTGKGTPFDANSGNETLHLETFTLSDETLTKSESLAIIGELASKPFSSPIGIRYEGKLYFVERSTLLADGLWVVDIDGAISMREITKLPGKKIHVAGGNVPFECALDEIKTVGRVVGVYSEVN